MGNVSTKNGRSTTEASQRVAFDLTPAMSAELDRILELTDLDSRPDVFRRAFTLLRIHVQAAQEGREIFMVDPKRASDRYLISLPFTVKSTKPAKES